MRSARRRYTGSSESIPDNSSTQERKIQHIQIIVDEKTQYRKKTTMLELVEVQPNGGAIAPREVDIESELLGKPVLAPMFISGMTGGHPATLEINKNIAMAAARFSIPMGIGSQRSMMENGDLLYTYAMKKFAKELILIGNIGASKLLIYQDERIQEMIDSIEADILAVHTNPGQESIQPEGDLDFRGVLKRIIEVANGIRQPVIVKEVGNGISKEVAARLDGKVYAIDTQGAGGTTWIGVETYRNKSKYGDAFWDWGIPTALSVLEAKSAFSGPVWASGGIRTPLDIVKAIAIGAERCGIAQPVISSERKGGSEGVYRFLSETSEGVRKEMARLGFSSLKELAKAKVTFKDPLKSALIDRNIKL
ncbi:MAG: type 2 isopentenyl-diphosphate Delta-isomerase [Candidatus Marsarchaeota archaeon]|nr:type 2 isopentenyl-diphosphate Delta-isomerase [Candidatus Marsarchaeota archaeon]MCL5111844.1 type 2 isopentenyl-diphosphate Delta-isomerase [Candidatus Marsarchaeota archaeon]